MILVSSLNQVYTNMERLSEELSLSPDLTERLGFVHAWYIDSRRKNDPKFGFSKFVGYDGLTADKYLASYKRLHGMNTERVLKEMSEEIRPGSPQYDEYHRKLSEWLASFGKTPRNPVRLMLLKSPLVANDEARDRRLLELVSAVADMLPLEQRHELRSRL